MGCCGNRRRGVTVTEEQKWDYINLSDFRSNSCLTPFSYAWLWLLAIISCAVYVADAFTAVNLLAFDKWTSQVKPKIPFEIARWIFAITIIISYVFLLYRWIMAIRVMRTGSVTECYLEPLAAIFQSMRLTKSGKGWRRFLVFAELTKSKNGVNYIALFVYFQFKSALLIIIAQGPRIAINGMTLYAVMQAQLLPVGAHGSNDRSGLDQFFFNIKLMVQQGNKQETVVYFSMLFSLVIWVIAALSLLLSVLFYIFFLWHYIPRSDGSLTQYCRRKIEVRLERIVNKKVKKAIEKQNQQRRKEEQKAIKKGALDPSQTQPTLPKLGMDDDAFSLKRSDTMSTNTTLPPYSSDMSRTNTMSTNRTMMKPSVPSLNERPGMPSRSNTQFSNFSNASYSSNAPLLNQASGMGTSSPMHPYGPPRPFSPMSQGGRSSPAPSSRGPLPPVDTSYSNGRYDPDPQLISPLPNDLRGPPSATSRRPYQEFSPFNNRGPQAGGQSYEMSPVDMTPTSADNYYAPQMPSILRAGSPAMSQSANGPLPRSGTAPPPRAGTAPPRPGVPASLQAATQRREASQPLPSRGMTGSVPQQRSATAPIQQPNWAGAPQQRSYSPAPQQRSYSPAPQRSYSPAPRGYDNV